MTGSACTSAERLQTAIGAPWCMLRDIRLLLRYVCMCAHLLLSASHHIIAGICRADRIRPSRLLLLPFHSIALSAGSHKSDVFDVVVRRDHFTGMRIWNACYAHAWDPSKTKLFTCGGPLAFGLIGSYMALWN